MVKSMNIEAHYDYGGDEFIFVELNEEMDLLDNFRVMAITEAITKQDVDAIIEVCPSNVSYLVRLDPDRLHPREAIDLLKEITASLPDVLDSQISTRIIDVPVLYGDPWTHETLMRFRDRHQDSRLTDLEYAARLNGYTSVEEFIVAHSGAPYWVSMIGFVPGLPWCYQMVPRDRQIEVPKYVRPRTDTPERSVGHGGAFACIYPVRGAGGYQLFGMTPAPIFNQDQTLRDFQDTLIFLRPGDILKFRAIERNEFDQVRQSVLHREFQYRVRDYVLSPRDVLTEPDLFARDVIRRLYDD